MNKPGNQLCEKTSICMLHITDGWGNGLGQHRDATATPLESHRTGRVGVPLVRRTASRRARPRRDPRTQRKEPRRRMTSGLPEVRRRPTLPTGVSVPSARAGLTALFGMGRGGTPRLKPPRISLERSQQDSTHFHTEDFGLLVRVG